MAEKTKFWYLKQFNYFETMSDDEMKNVERASSMQSIKPHQPIYFPDTPSDAIYFLKEGHVKISRINADGKEIIIDIIGPGEVFGELSVVSEEDRRSEIAEALDDIIICAIKKEMFENMMKMNPEMNLQVTKRIGLRLRKIEERVTDLAFKDSRQRIATFLVRHAEEFGKTKGGTISVKMHLTHQEIALLTASSRQTVTTTLNELRSSGIIDFTRNEISIKDFPSLKTIAR